MAEKEPEGPSKEFLALSTNSKDMKANAKNAKPSQLILFKTRFTP